MRALYLYITNFREFLTRQAEFSLLGPGALVLWLVSVMMSGGFYSGFLLMQFFGMLTLAGGLFLHSVVLDFIAQFLGAKGQSFRLLGLMSLSYLPFLLMAPLSGIFGWDGVWMILALVGVGVLQFFSVGSLYGLSGLKLWAVFLIPILGSVFLPFIVVLFLVLGV